MRAETGTAAPRAAHDLMQEYCRTRDRSLRNQLVAEHLYIADIVARRYQGRGVDYDDLHQVASLALVRALDRFDCERGVLFSTFATPTMIGEVKNYFRDKAKPIRLPRAGTEIVKRLSDSREALMQALGRTPLPAELASHMDVSVDQVLEALAYSVGRQTLSLDAALGDEDGDDFLASLGQADDEYERIEFNDWLSREVEKLGDTERHILEGRYARSLSQREIANELGVSQMYVSRLERKLLARFRASLSP